jgi:hypothetical protein
MNTDRHGLIYEEETLEIIGCVMEVLNALGHGLLEKPYENALVVEFGLKGIPCRQQTRFDVKITGLKVGLILNFKRPKLEWKRIVL